MKYHKKIAFLVGVFIVILIFCAFKIYQRAFITPPPSQYLAENIKDWVTHFDYVPSDSWKLEDDRIYYYNEYDAIGFLTLNLSDIPSIGTDMGDLNVKVNLLMNLDVQDSTSFCGFELSSKDSPSQRKVRFGLWGNGKPFAMDGNNKDFPNNTIGIRDLDLNNVDSIPFRFEIKKSREFLFLSFGYSFLPNKDGRQWAYVYKIPHDYFEGDGRTLSLFARNSKDPQAVWFNNLRIRKDWSRFD